MRKSQSTSAYDRMVRLLARRDHSRMELRQKLSKWEHPSEEIDDVIARAEDCGWLKDERLLAERESERLSRQGKSASQIRQWLRKRGLPEARTSNEESETIAILKVIERAWPRLLRSAHKAHSKNQKARQTLEGELKLRLHRLLMARGFSGPPVSKAIQAAIVQFRSEV